MEYLIAKDDAAHSLRYGVLRNPFVPVDGYEAEVRITPAAEGATLSFKSQFTLDADADEAAIKQGLIGAYQLMAESADQRLASP